MDEEKEAKETSVFRRIHVAEWARMRLPIRRTAQHKGSGLTLSDFSTFLKQSLAGQSLKMWSFEELYAFMMRNCLRKKAVVIHTLIRSAIKERVKLLASVLEVRLASSSIGNTEINHSTALPFIEGDLPAFEKSMNIISDCASFIVRRPFSLLICAELTRVTIEPLQA